MKSVLFAVKASNIPSSTLEAFETKMMQYLRTQSREYSDAIGNHCDHKEGLLSACNQFRPDVLIINEELTGNGDIVDVIKNIKSQFPALQVVVLLTRQRSPGDARLANLAMMGVYNWMAAPWKVEQIGNLILSPKTMKDVEAYIPKVSATANGLAFDTKIVDKSELDRNKLDDLDDVGVGLINSQGSSLVNAGTVSDINDTVTSNSRQSYQKVIDGGFVFKGGVKPHHIEPKAPEVKPEPIPEPVKPVVEVKPVKVEPIPVPPIPAPAVQKPVIEERKREPVLPKEPVSPRSTHEELTRELEEAAAQVTEALEQPKPVQTPKEERKVEREVPKNTISDEKAALLDKIGKVSSPKQSHPEIKKPEPVEKQQTVEKVAPAKAPAQPAEKKPFDVAKLKLPNAHKILFLHAAPLTSSLAIQIAYFLKQRGQAVTFVDLNKNSFLKPFYKDGDSLEGIPTIRSTFKDYKDVDCDYVIADAVAGNGIEKIIPMFDHVSVIVPSDLNVVSTFSQRYSSLLKNYGYVVDKAFAGGYTVKQMKEVGPGARYYESIKIVPSVKDSPEFGYKDILDAERDGTPLVDREEYLVTLRFLLEGLK